MVLESILSGIAVSIFEQAWKLGGAGIEDVKKTYRKVDAINRLQEACTRYERRYRERHGQIRIMPGLMRESIPLESIYITTRFLEDISKRYFSAEHILEEICQSSTSRSFQNNNAYLDASEVAKQKQFLVVLGDPGQGKSTFLKKLGTESFNQTGFSNQRYIPIFIELKELNDITKDLETIISSEFEICGFPAAESFTRSALTEGKLLILLDGLDELPKECLNSILNHIENFVDLYDRNRFVLSCRRAAYRSSLRRFTDVVISEIGEEQIHKFIINWFNYRDNNENNFANEFLSILTESDSKAILELAHTPLLLTYLCLVYEHEQALPSTRSILYEKVLDILLKEWAIQKRVERDPIYIGFYPNLEKGLLSLIAYESFKDGQLFFSKSDVTEKIIRFIGDTVGISNNIDGEAVLKAIEEQQGIIVERSTGIYSFSHLTIQEYLSAYYIVDKSLVSETVDNYALDVRWREVFLLMGGLLGGNIQKLWHSLEISASSSLNSNQKLQHIVEWVLSFSGNKKKQLNYKLAALNIFCIYQCLCLSYSKKTISAFAKIESLMNSFVEDYHEDKSVHDMSKQYLDIGTGSNNIEFSLNRIPQIKLMDNVRSLTKSVDNEQSELIEFAIDRLMIWFLCDFLNYTVDAVRNANSTIIPGSKIAVITKFAEAFKFELSKSNCRKEVFRQLKSNAWEEVILPVLESLIANNELETITGLISFFNTLSQILSEYELLFYDSILAYFEVIIERLSETFLLLEISDRDQLNQFKTEADDLLKNSRSPESVDEVILLLNSLKILILSHLDMSESIRELKRPEIEALADYLYITDLIVSSKNSGVRISRKEWEAVESRLLSFTIDGTSSYLSDVCLG